MGGGDERICQNKKQGIEEAVFFLHDLPKMRQSVQQKLRGAVCPDKLKFMSKIIYNKLVRDKIPEIIKSKGEFPDVSQLSADDFKMALKAKMVEESQELNEATDRSEVLNELSDIAELIRAVAQNYEIPLEEIESYRLKKLRERGGFEKRLRLNSVEEK